MKDILLDENGDMLCANGDIVTGVSDMQHQRLLLEWGKGVLKEYPTATVGIFNYLEAEDSAAMLREIRQRFTDDGMNIQKIDFTEGKLTINAVYK